MSRYVAESDAFIGTEGHQGQIRYTQRYIDDHHSAEVSATVPAALGTIVADAPGNSVRYPWNRVNGMRGA
jgi:hypothetical protein